MIKPIVSILIPAQPRAADMAMWTSWRDHVLKERDEMAALMEEIALQRRRECDQALATYQASRADIGKLSGSAMLALALLFVGIVFLVLCVLYWR